MSGRRRPRLTGPERASAARERERLDRALAAAPKRSASEAEAESLPFHGRVCVSKLAFRTRAAFGKWLKAHPPNANMSQVFPYRCPTCDQWHSTSTRPGTAQPYSTSRRPPQA